MKPFHRSDRVSELILRNLSDILQKDINDPRLKMTTITGVKMTKDLKIAKVYFVTSKQDRAQKETSEAFQRSCKYIKRLLAPRLGLRYMPELRFYYDESFDYGERIDNLLKLIQPDQDDKPNHISTGTE